MRSASRYGTFNPSTLLHCPFLYGNNAIMFVTGTPACAALIIKP